MRGRYYVIDDRDKNLNGNFKPAVKGTANVIYLKNQYTAAKEDLEDRKRAIISVSIISTFLVFFTIIVMVSNNPRW